MSSAIRLGKVYNAIKNLPENPSKRIYWIVYNNDMIEHTESLISELKGEDYLNKFVTVVAKSDPSKDRTKGSVYFDPGLLDLIGNGNC